MLTLALHSSVQVYSFVKENVETIVKAPVLIELLHI